MYATLRVSALVALGSLALAGCSGGGLDVFGGGSSASDVTTSSVAATQAAAAPRVDPACGNLALEIDTLRREGVADKVEKAAAKKYKMTTTDLGKANQLNRANGEFQAKCSTLPRTAAVADPALAAAAAPAKAAVTKAATTKAAPAAAKTTAAAGASGVTTTPR